MAKNLLDWLKSQTLDRTNLDEKVVGAVKKGISNVKQAYNQGGGLDQYNVFSRPQARVVSDVRNIGQGLGLKPQTSDAIGYGLRGASQLSPSQGFRIFNPNSQSSQMYRAEAPVTDAQKQAQSVGRSLYGYALTAPIGAAKGAYTLPSMALSAAKHAATSTTAGAAFGAGFGAIGAKVNGQNVKQGAMEGAKQGAYQGFKSGPYLAATSPLTSKIISKVAPGSSFIVRQALQRVTGGALNVGEDELLAKIDGLKPEARDRVLSFALGFGLTGNDELIKRIKTGKAKPPVKTMAESRLNKQNPYRVKVAGEPARVMSEQDYVNWTRYYDSKGIKYESNPLRGQGGFFSNGKTEQPPVEMVPPKEKIIKIKNKNATPEQVAATLPDRTNTFVEDTLGYSTKNPIGGVKEASGWTKALRKGQDFAATKIESGMASENPYVRNAATGIQNFFRGAGMSPERAAASTELKGSIATGNQRAYEITDSLYKALGNNKESLTKINAVLDPEISSIKVSFDDLSPVEKQVYNTLKDGMDLIHDTSYANGSIAKEVYTKNKGKYVPRLYDATELPAEVNQFITQSSKKINNNIYKAKGDVNAWKQEHSLNDPVYGLGKRLAQVETNTAVKKYTDFLANNQRFVSDVEKPGFTKLSDSPSYGALSGKYVMNSAAEDLKGFFFSNDTMQKVYDVFRAYDKLPPRQLQKKILTVFNPTTNVGNVVSDQIFGFVTGVDPLTLNKNLIELKRNPSSFKQISDYLMRQGVVGTDITRSDFVDRLGMIDTLASGKKTNAIKKGADALQSFYGGTDDAYKAAAFKALLNKGFSLEEATRKVADGFQNYSSVGKYYDIASKTPIVGQPFIKFQGDLMRIIKNGAVNNPLGLIAFLGTLKGIAELSSRASGETPEDKKTREERFGAPMIPGLNIPLTWQTPIGEINVARYISPFYAANETDNMVSKILPGIPSIDTKKDLATNISQNVKDPMISPIVQALINRDFRGKPISDPNENKYKPSTLTGQEKLANSLKFIGRGYTPPTINSIIDVGAAAKGEPNMYGTPQTVPQAIARVGGVKISNYGPEQVQQIRTNEAKYSQLSNESTNSQIKAIQKQQLLGEITPEQAQKRIAKFESQKSSVDTSLLPSSEKEVAYINESGNLSTINIGKYDAMPSKTNYEKRKKEEAGYKNAVAVYDSQMPPEQKAQLYKKLGTSEEEVDYAKKASDNDTDQTLFIQDQLASMTPEERDSYLLRGRSIVNNGMLISDSVLTKLVASGEISKSESKALKTVSFVKDNSYTGEDAIKIGDNTYKPVKKSGSGSGTEKGFGTDNMVKIKMPTAVGKGSASKGNLKLTAPASKKLTISKPNLQKKSIRRKVKLRY